MKNFHEINKIFWDFVQEFDAKEDSIIRKIVHTYAVASNCYDTACRYKFNEEDRMFCYLMGMFHDLGRFEQWTKYKTFVDSESENHGIIGRRILETRFTPESLDLTPERFELLADTIQYHIIEFKGDNENLWKYLRIIHSADAYDNLFNTSIGLAHFNSYTNGYSEEMLNKFLNQEKVYMLPSKTKLDRLFKSIGNAFCITVDYMRNDVIAKNYFDIIYDHYVNTLNDNDKLVFTNAIEYIKKNYKP